MSPAKYELGFYIPEDNILHNHSGENFKSYIEKIVSSRFRTPARSQSLNRLRYPYCYIVNNLIQRFSLTFFVLAQRIRRYEEPDCFGICALHALNRLYARFELARAVTTIYEHRKQKVTRNVGCGPSCSVLRICRRLRYPLTQHMSCVSNLSALKILLQRVR
jgi:hypothetical protein